MKRILLSGMAALGLLATAPAAEAGDWSGAYVGTYVAAVYGTMDPALGLMGGYSMQTNNVVYGAEADVFRSNVGDWEVFGRARLGYALTDTFLMHVTGGAGNYLGTTNLWSLGVGGEVKVSNTISLRADYERHNTWGSGLGTSQPFMKGGVVWNF